MSNELHVVFGTGPVGMSIMDALYAKGHSIRMVNRSGRTSEPLPEGVELINGDASYKDFTSEAAQGASVIYHTLNPRYSRWVDLFPGLQASVVAATEATGAKLVVMENLYMYGDPQGVPMTEERPHNAQTVKGQLRSRMTRDLMEAHEAGRIRVVIGRASDFIGPRVMESTMGGKYVFQPALEGKAAQVFGNPDMPHSYTYMPDIGRALVALGAHDDALGQVWHMPTPKAIPTRQLLELIFAEIGRPFKQQRVSKLMLRFAGMFNKDAGEVIEMVYQFETPFVIDDSKFVEHFGWGATDIKTVVEQTVAWFQKNGR